MKTYRLDDFTSLDDLRLTVSSTSRTRRRTSPTSPKGYDVGPQSGVVGADFGTGATISPVLDETENRSRLEPRK